MRPTKTFEVDPTFPATLEELRILREWGVLLHALDMGRIAPWTERQKAFLAEIRGETSEVGVTATVWLKYRSHLRDRSREAKEQRQNAERTLFAKGNDERLRREEERRRMAELRPRDPIELKREQDYRKFRESRGWE